MNGFKLEKEKVAKCIYTMLSQGLSKFTCILIKPQMGLFPYSSGLLPILSQNGLKRI